MKTLFVRSILVSIVTVVLTLVVRYLYRIDSYLSDASSLGTFTGMFGTLYGIMTAFIVFEVWGQYGKTVRFIELEAQNWERLYRLTLYFQDEKLSTKMRNAIETYIRCVVDGKFKALGSGERNKESAKYFRNIVQILRDIKTTNEHSQKIHDLLLDQFGNLAEVRTERINQSLSRLPMLLKLFLYISSAIAVGTFVIMPFANVGYSVFVVLTFTFILMMVLQLIEDLDNPFVGFWNLTPAPFERALKHIEEDYS